MRAALVIAVMAWTSVARADQRSSVVVVIDRSLPAVKLAAVTGALADAARAMPADTRLGVVLAGERPALDVAIGPAPKARIRGVRAAPRGDLVAAMRFGSTQLAPLRGTHRRILIVTDGNDLIPIRSAARALRQTGVFVSAVGYQSLNRVTLEDIANGGGGRLFLADDAQQLAAAFAEAGQPMPDGTVVRDNAVAIVMDRSASVQGPQFEAAKETARAIVGLLAPNDTLSVVAFDSESMVYLPPQRAANRMRISNEIARMQTGGGTNLYAGLKAGADVLAGVDAPVKQLVFISDGDAPMDGVLELVHNLRAAHIGIAVVGVQGADRKNLDQIALAGDGRLFMVEDIGQIPRIFMRETVEQPW